jgi:hypothetical protein
MPMVEVSNGGTSQAYIALTNMGSVSPIYVVSSTNNLTSNNVSPNFTLAINPGNYSKYKVVHSAFDSNYAYAVLKNGSAQEIGTLDTNEHVVPNDCALIVVFNSGGGGPYSLNVTLS